MSIFDAVQLGLQDGHSRLSAIPPDNKLFLQIQQVDFAPALAADLTPALVKLLDTGDVSEHFARLFAEMTMVAQTARATYNEPALTQEQLGLALEGFKAFFNSFRHL